MQSIVVAAAGDAGDPQLFGVAAQLAAHFGGHVRVAPVFSDPAADLVFYGSALGQISPEAIDRINASLRETQDKLESLGRDVAAAEGLTPAAFVVEKRELQPGQRLASAAVLADLVAFSGAAARSADVGELFARTLIEMRAPCLVTNSARYAAGSAAIAWDGSPQAGRAVRAALPLIKAAARVIIIQNVEDAGLDPDDADLQAIETYLAHHGVANVTKRAMRGGGVAASLLEAAQQEQCELLVAGGYGRSRLYELVLGGTTRTLVHAERAPHLLLAH